MVAAAKEHAINLHVKVVSIVSMANVEIVCLTVSAAAIKFAKTDFVYLRHAIKPVTLINVKHWILIAANVSVHVARVKSAMAAALV